MSGSENVLEDGFRFQLTLQPGLGCLTQPLRKQLLESEVSVVKHNEELDRRIQQNALLWPCQGASSKPEQDQNDKEPNGVEAHCQEWKSSPPQTTSQTCSKNQQCERLVPSKTTQMRKEQEDEMECQKQFWAHPVPSHVHQALYHKMMEQREKERKHDIEQRKQFLLSIQKPFKFQEREKDKRIDLLSLNQDSQDHVKKTVNVKKSFSKESGDSPVSKLKAASRKSHPSSCGPKLRTAERARKEKLESLYEAPSFKPQIIHQVPDFKKLHKQLQKEFLRKPQNVDGTKCQPFYLRTADLPPRKRRMSLENSEVPSPNVGRSALTSLSTATLPVFTTDAVNKRNMAIRNSMEMRDKKNQESADWLRAFNMRSQAMKRSITLHTKLLEPKEVLSDKVQQHRLADQQKMKEYARELRDMRERVREQPYMFEQVKQKNARARAEEMFRNKLKKYGITELFIQQHGEQNEEESASSRLNDNADESHSGSSREENVDDGEKIEDVKKSSVKSKGEELQ